MKTVTTVIIDVMLLAVFFHLAKEAVQAVEQVEKDNYTCGKKCDKNSVLVRFCISDFAIRARVEKRSIGKNGRLRYRIRVTKYYKTGKMPITKSKKHYIEMRGRDITCKCKFLQPRRTYLILGKEDKRIKTLFLDNYTYAIEWSQGGKKLAKLHKKKATCPAKLTTVWHV